MNAPEETIIFQNYFTPYRHVLFERIGRKLPGLTVLYSQGPEQEGRRWVEEAPSTYAARRLPSLKLGPLVFFAVPWKLLGGGRRKVVVLHDDNPAGLSMVVSAVLFRVLGARTLLWVEHTPTSGRGIKLGYQHLCSRVLMALTRHVVAFSSMSEAYIRILRPQARISRMVQSVPQPATAPAPRSGCIRRFGFIGSAQPRKNLAALLHAFGGLCGEDVELHVAGVPPRGGGDKRVLWWGYVDGEERERFFSAIDMLVLPSLQEPWGLVVNEALDRGALAMVSKACGSRELVGNIDPALVFEPTSSGIAAALERSLSLDAAALRERAAIAAKAYSTDAAAERLSVIIDSVR